MNTCCETGFCLSCGEAWERAGFDSKTSHEAHLAEHRALKNERLLSSIRQYELNAKRDAHFLNTLDKALKTLTEDDYMEENRVSSQHALYR